jgi:hypothetical protein
MHVSQGNHLKVLIFVFIGIVCLPMEAGAKPNVRKPLLKQCRSMKSVATKSEHIGGVI